MDSRDFLRYMGAIVLLISCFQLLTGQELRSEKAGIYIRNKPEEEINQPPDLTPPGIGFISPKIDQGNSLTSTEPEMDLIGKAVDSSGISFVSVNSEIRSVTPDGIFTSRIFLEPGENRIRVVAMDTKENLREIMLSVEYVPPVVTLADRINSESRYFGLIIGINRYMDSDIPDLDNPVRDAERLHEVLSGSYHFREEDIRFLKNATRADIIRSLDELGQQITPKDNLLIYYAGHGWWDSDANNGYWLPADAHRHEKTNWFRNSTLVDYLKEIDTKHTLLIADACFGGSIFKTRSAFGSRERAYEKLYELPSRKAMTSGTLTEVPDRSAFTRYLIQRLEVNDSKYLSSEELFSSFRMAVIHNSDAVPQYGEIENVGDQGGDFIFLK